MKFNIITLGCKVNSYESEYIRESLESSGYIYSEDNPNIIVINTCSVTNQSDAKSRHMIRNARKNKDAIIVVCGCSSQNHKEEMTLLGADIVLGNKGKSYIPIFIEEFLARKEKIVCFEDMKSLEFENMTLKNEKDKTRGFVKVQDGCNNFCSYCIIPYLRGNIRSKDIELAFSEVENLVNSNHKEIVLTGIHIGTYGFGLGYDLTDLIRKISKIDNLERIRISSIEVTEINDKFLEEFKNNKKICNHLHIPLQSGSDTILKKMNRHYSAEYFLKKIDDIRKIRPDISITTDLIVGFPYEEEKEWLETIEFIKKVKFTKIHAFPFSLRSGTKAEEMKDYFVKDSVKKKRVKEVLELSLKLEEEYYKKFVGKVVPVVFESSDNGSKGHSDNYILVHTDEEIKEGDLAYIKIDSVDKLYVKGHKVDC